MGCGRLQDIREEKHIRCVHPPMGNAVFMQHTERRQDGKHQRSNKGFACEQRRWGKRRRGSGGKRRRQKRRCHPLPFVGRRICAIFFIWSCLLVHCLLFIGVARERWRDVGGGGDPLVKHLMQISALDKRGRDGGHQQRTRSRRQAVDLALLAHAFISCGGRGVLWEIQSGWGGRMGSGGALWRGWTFGTSPILCRRHPHRGGKERGQGVRGPLGTREYLSPQVGECGHGTSTFLRCSATRWNAVVWTKDKR